MDTFEDAARFVASKKKEIEKEKELLKVGNKIASNQVEKSENQNRFSGSGDKDVAKTSYDSESQNRFSGSQDTAVAKYSYDTGRGEKLNIPTDDVPERKQFKATTMLKTGEFSPNNLNSYFSPAAAAAASASNMHGIRGLGAYEEINRITRRSRQREYRECLEQQTKIKQQINDKVSKMYSHNTPAPILIEKSSQNFTDTDIQCSSKKYTILNDKEVQCDSLERPYINGNSVNSSLKEFDQKQSSSFRSIAVQTDNNDSLSPSQAQRNLTRAERELSPKNIKNTDGEAETKNHEMFTSPDAFFDTEAIRLRNLKAEQEAIAKKLYYQQELKRQITEQQRIKEERKQREKLLEQAERRRLEQQLAQLERAQQAERDKFQSKQIVDTTGAAYETIRTTIRKELKSDKKQQKNLNENFKFSEKSKLPLYYAYTPENSAKNYSTKSLLTNPNLEQCLKKNLNPDLGDYEPAFLRKNVADMIVRDRIEKSDKDSPNFVSFGQKLRSESNYYERPKEFPIPVLRHSPIQNNFTNKKDFSAKRVDFSVHNPDFPVDKPNFPVEKRNFPVEKPNYPVEKPNFPVEKRNFPVEKPNFSVKNRDFSNKNQNDAMKLVENKWQVPIVKKTIVRSDKNVLTQLGSIRRELQLEQLKLDKLIAKENI